MPPTAVKVSNNRKIFVFSSKVYQILSPVPSLVLPCWTIPLSSPSADQPPRISKPSVSMETIVPATQTLTFLNLVLANRGERPVLSIRQSHGLVHAVRGTRLGRETWCCVAPHRRWVKQQLLQLIQLFYTLFSCASCAPLGLFHFFVYILIFFSLFLITFSRSSGT